VISEIALNAANIGVIHQPINLTFRN